LDCCPLLFGESPNVDPLLRGEFILFGVESLPIPDGERRVLGDIVRDSPSESSLVELKDQMIEGASKVVEAVAEDERKIRVNRMQLADVKAICESVVVTIHSNGVSAKIETTVEVLQDAVMLSGAVHLGYSTFETSGTHATP